jgi:Rap1a immunity proteins
MFERRIDRPALALGTMLVLWGVGVLGAMLPGPARADDIFMTRSNADLLKYCRITVQAFDAAKRGRNVVPNDLQGSWDLATAVAGCQGFIEGYRDAMDAATRSNTSVGLFNLVCVPETVNTFDMAAAYVQWGNANPGDMNKSASMGVYRAWRQAWPCSVIVSQ